VFRYPYYSMKNSDKYQSIHDKANQLVRYYRIPASVEKEQALNTILQKIKQGEKSKTKPAINISFKTFAVISAAASIAILVTLYFLTASVTYSGLTAENLAFRLPDNSRVVLYENSEIQIRKYFWKRKVNLNGVAYFEVEKGNNFRVQTTLGYVEVLGTRFMVSELDNSLGVQCFEGKVKATIKNNSVILTQGTKFSGTVDAAQKSEIEEMPEYPDFAWFIRNFSKENLESITTEMEKFFGIEIEIQNGSARNFSGTIQTGKLDGALDIICESLQLQYKYADKNKVIIFK
jgi:transmembrane sensor